MNGPWVSRWVKVNGIRTHYLEAGDGPPVLLLHGGGPGSSGLWGWCDTMPALAAHFRTISLDQLGFGETDKPAGLAYSHQDRVDHVGAFVDTLCLAPVNLVGNSMGAYAAIKYALDHPDRVDRVAGLGSGTVAQAMGIEHRPPPWEFDGTEASFAEGLSATLLHPPSAEMIAGRMALAQLPGAVEAASAMRAFGRRLREDASLQQQFSILARLPKYAKPALMLWGKEDRFAPVDPMAIELQKLIPHIPIEYVDNAGHQCQHDAPDVVNARLIQFFLHA